MILLVGTAAFANPQANTASAHPEKQEAKNEAKKLPPADSGPPTKKAETVDENLPPALTEKTEGLNPELLKRFDSFRTFIYQQYGVVIEINSGYRTSEEQAQLYRTLPRGMANPPGQSPHELGEAIDYTQASPAFNQHLPAFGLKAPFPGVENWHVERAERQ